MTQGQPSTGRRGLRAALVALAAATAVLGLSSASASAASTHPFAEEWSTGSGCNPRDVATDFAGNVYVACAATTAEGLDGTVRKFSPTGTPIPFTASKSYLAGNQIIEDPGNASELHQFGSNLLIAVDRTPGSPRFGYIYVSGNDCFCTGGGSSNVDIFAPSGEYLTSIRGGFFTGTAGGVGLDEEGYVYVVFEGCCGRAHMSKYDPQNFHELLRMVPYRGPFGQEPFRAPCCTGISPDTDEGIWVGWGGNLFDGSGNFGKIEAEEWSTNTNAGEKDPTTVVAKPSPYMEEAFPEATCPEIWFLNSFSGFECQMSGHTFGVDLSNNDVYGVTGGETITPYSEGVPGDPVHQDGPSFGTGKLNQSEGLEIDQSGNVWVTKQPNTIVKFLKGSILPTVTTKEAAIADIGHTEATVRAVVDPAGGGAITDCKVRYGLKQTYTGAASPVTCVPSSFPGPGPQEVSAVVTGLTVGKTYHFRYEATNANGSNIGGDRLFEAKAVLNLETLAATGVDRHEATLQGHLDPDNIPTEYWYEFGPNTSYGQTTLDSEGKGTAITGPSGTIKSTPLLLTHLQEGHTYHYRLVGKNSLGVTKGKDIVVRTSSAPEISGVGATNVTDTTADVHAKINPVGYPTTYKFEYGTTPSYGSSLPLAGNELTGTTPQFVEVHLSGLPAGSTIHYRVVATNEWGTRTTEDITFNFRPPDCPNAHVRQITGSGYLPDCRAYELVSPGYAGAVQLLPGEALRTFNETFGGSEFAQSPQNFGYASDPSRFVYWGGLGAVNGVDTPNSLIDIYLATRTNNGWVTSEPGLKGNETKYSYGRTCSENLDFCADHIGGLVAQNPETGETESIPKSQAPFLYKAGGTRLGRLPTNVSVVKEGSKFIGDWMFSGNFSHFIFSTQTQFAPNGETSPPGSVYDNNIGAATVTVISKDGAGNNIESEPSVSGDPNRVTGIAGVSKDGTRVLMAGTTQPFCNINSFPFECPYILGDPARLYMRVGGAGGFTDEVSRGKEVNFVGMTRDARKVYFTTTEKLIPGTGEGQDNDTSLDLYMWSEEGDELTLVSREGGLGNTDKCSATWVQKCGVQPLTPQFMNYSELFEQKARVQGIDDILANDSGDIYFYSPEDLVPGEVGGDGQRNLYLFRNGHLHLVTTFDPGTQVERSTISQDGSHAAFMTRSSLTAYDTEGQQEVYGYNADAGTIRCASCNPAGTPPQKGSQTVTVSEAGPFMSDDGRVFFGSREGLVPQDTDGIRDVYEYVNGRPQLITTGTGNRENTGGLETVSIFFGNVQIGLEAVSRDGVDVYFSSFETLTPDDKNGSFLKFYDARSGGGFDFSPDLGPCAAADECHGASTQPPPPAQTGTGGKLGASGNLPAKGKHHKKHRTNKHRKRGKRHGGHRNG